LGRYGTFIVERAGNDVDQAIEHLAKWKSNIHLISQLIQNDVSSTKVLCFLESMTMGLMPMLFALS
jgi:nicotinamide mononucleotide adenylyltransferase